MDDLKYSAIEHGGNSKRVFGRMFDDHKTANALLAAHRWAPILPRHYAAHGGYPGTCQKLLKNLANQPQAPIKAVPLAGCEAAGRPPLLYVLTKAGYDRLLRLAEVNWPDAWPDEALGPRHGQRISSVTWYRNWHHDNVTRDVLLAAERDARYLKRARLIDQVAEFKYWGGKQAPTAIDIPSLMRRMKSDAANIMELKGKSYADELEIDRGTGTGSSNDPDKIFQTLEGKIRSYWEVLVAGLVKEKYNVTSGMFRVLFVTVNETRAQNFVNLANDCGLPPIETGKRPITPNDIFYATTTEAAIAQFFGPHWLKADGSMVALAERISSDD